jgi:catechol 2,3-dioxygenase-like lactoylglutathione lyase family enzyme
MRFMLVEIQGAAGTPFEQRLFDPGVTRFSIQVRDLDAAFARVKSQVVVETAGGGPVFTQRPRNDTRAVMMRDPDGFVLEFVQADPPPQTDVPATSNVYNARSSLAVDDTEKSLAFYRGLLGFEARPTNTVAEAVLALEGTPAAVARTTATSPPGSTNVWFLWEFSRIARTPHAPAFADPGASALSLLVENLPAMLERMKAAGVKVETPGGQPIALGPSARGAVVRSPDGLLIELREQTAGR